MSDFEQRLADLQKTIAEHKFWRAPQQHAELLGWMSVCLDAALRGRLEDTREHDELVELQKLIMREQALAVLS